jgi:hypothetical protein
MGIIYDSDALEDYPEVRDYGLPANTIPSGTPVNVLFDERATGGGLGSLLRGDEQRAAASGYESRVQAARSAAAGLPNARPTSPTITAEQANQQVKDAGLTGYLKFEKPIRQRELDLLTRWKKDELIRADVLGRQDDSLSSQIAMFGAGALGSMVDPVNLALSFVPVVPEAQFARLATRFGPTGARLIRGAAEGAAGNAAVEPLIALQAQNQQADYSAYDSLVNIAFGSVIGSGLHAGFGKFSDWIGGHPMDTREMALRGAVAAVADDRPVTAADLFRIDETRRGALLGSSSLDPSAGMAHWDELEAYLLGQPRDVTPDAEAPAPQPNAVLPAVKQNGTVQVFDTVEQAQAAAARAGDDFQVAPTDGGFILTRPAILSRVGDFQSERQALRAMGAMPDAAARDLAVVPAGDGRFTILEGATPEQLKAMRDHPGAVQLPEPRPAVSFFDTPPVMASADRQALLEQVTQETVQNLRRSYDVQPADQTAINAIAARAAGYDRPITPEATAQEVADLVSLADEGINHLYAEGRLTNEDLAEIMGGDELVAQARNRGAGIQAAAACFARALA